VQAEKHVTDKPVVELLRSQPRRLFLGMGTRFVEGFTFNLFSVFFLAHAVNEVGYDRSTVLNAIMLGSAIGVVLVLVSGALSDRFGRRPVYAVGAVVALLFAVPATRLVEGGSTLGIVVVMVGGLGLVYGVVYGPLAAFWSELFDTRYRYSALSFLYQMSGIVASGLTPLIAAWLVQRAGGGLDLVAAYAVGVAVFSLVCMKLLPETRGRDLTVDEAPARARESRAA
jgi:MFS transporter, MHS family, shikimate and dehydroshikimate transport protein